MEQAVSQSDRDWAMYAHLAGLLWLTGFPFAQILGPLVIYLKTRKESAFACANARASLNFQITITLLGMLAIATFIVLIGVELSSLRAPAIVAFPIWLAALAALGLVAFNATFCMRGAMAAARGVAFTYPFSIAFVH